MHPGKDLNHGNPELIRLSIHQQYSTVFSNETITSEVAVRRVGWSEQKRFHGVGCGPFSARTVWALFDRGSCQHGVCIISFAGLTVLFTPHIPFAYLLCAKKLREGFKHGSIFGRINRSSQLLNPSCKRRKFLRRASTNSPISALVHSGSRSSPAITGKARPAPLVRTLAST